MENLSAKIGVLIEPVFQSKKISQVLTPKVSQPRRTAEPFPIQKAVLN